MDIHYCAQDRLGLFEGRSDLLAIMCYGTTAVQHDACPCFSIPMASQPAGLCEVFTGGPARYGRSGVVSYAHDGEWLFAGAMIAEEGDLCATVARTYEAILRASVDLGYPCLIRAWQHFPDIHRPEAGLERYRQFNRGRHQALFPYLAQGGLRPAATCVGSAGPGLFISVLARATAGTAIENPRQLAAYQYPRVYGPQPPDFVRAMKVTGSAGDYLWISGTAAIIGHESQAPGDFNAQVHETFVNLGAVADHAGFGLSAEVLSAKVYTRSPATPALPGRWHKAPVLYLRGDICRAELAVEVETVLRVPRAAS